MLLIPFNLVVVIATNPAVLGLGAALLLGWATLGDDDADKPLTLAQLDRCRDLSVGPYQ